MGEQTVLFLGSELMIQWFVPACGSGTVAVRNRANGVEGSAYSYTSLELSQGSWQYRQT